MNQTNQAKTGPRRNKAVNAMHAGLRDAAHALAMLNGMFDDLTPDVLKTKASIIGGKISEATLMAEASFPPSTVSKLPGALAVMDGPVALVSTDGGRVNLYVYGVMVASQVHDAKNNNYERAQALADRINLAASEV